MLNAKGRSGWTRFWCLMLVLGMIVGLLTGCGASDDGNVSEDENYSDTLTVGLAADIGLDPWLNISQNATVGRAIYDSLMKVEEDGTVSPMLAESYEYLDDLHLRLHLRHGVKFHDGSDFTSKDVAYYFESIKNYAQVAARFSLFDVENSKVVDDYTYDLAMSYAFADAVNLLGTVYIPCSKAVEEMGIDAFNNAPVGTGPFKVVSWETGSAINMEAFEEYWLGKPATQKLVFRFIPETTSRIAELETGGVDLILGIGTEDIARIDAEEGLHVVTGESPQYALLTFSQTDEILSNQDVRYALGYAIDWDAVIDACYDGYASRMKTMWPAFMFGTEPIGDFPYDLDQAKSLMEKAGYADGFKITLQVDGAAEKKVAEVVQNMWGKLNVETEIIQMSMPNFEAAGNQYQVAIRTGGAVNLSDCIVIYTKSFGRSLQVQDDYMDGLVQQSKAEMDAEKRAKIVAELQQYVYDTRWAIPVAQKYTAYAMSDKVENFTFNAFGAPFLYQVRVHE